MIIIIIILFIYLVYVCVCVCVSSFTHFQAFPNLYEILICNQTVAGSLWLAWEKNNEINKLQVWNNTRVSKWQI